MFEILEIMSHKGPYRVNFTKKFAFPIDVDLLKTSHIIIDKQVATLYKNVLQPFLSSAVSILEIEATELNKSLEKMPIFVEHLVSQRLRRTHPLIAIGGGVIQDITCFLAANILRGVDWWFIPTTLLAQADSCIGSKSSINCAGVKNILGTFTPPKQIFIELEFLSTLKKQDICSGVGEMLKVHAIEGTTAFSQIVKDYPWLFENKDLMAKYIRRSLEIKKAIIEQDEFDRGIRQVMNYGHTFGHAIETATAYRVPHGIAVSIGMDMANYIARQLGRCPADYFEKAHLTLLANYQDFRHESIILENFLSAISKDKKNTESNMLNVILPNESGTIERCSLPSDTNFIQLCSEYFSKIFAETVSAGHGLYSHADNIA